MGVRGLNKFITQICEKNDITAIQHKKFDEYKNKIMVIDVLQKIYSYGIAIRDSGEDKFSVDGKIINHIYAIIFYTKFLIKQSIKPLYVFDGKIPEIKNNVLTERKERKDTSYKKCDNFVDTTSDEYIKHFKRSYSLSDEQIKECKELLKAFGIPYIESPEEADSQCAAIVSSDKNIYGVISDDIDTLVFGAKKICKDFSGKHNSVIEMNLDNILKVLLIEANNIRKINYKQPITKFNYYNFIDYVSMLNTDYFSGLKNITPSQVFELFILNNCDVYDTIDYIKKNNDTYNIDIPDDFIQKWDNVKKYYTEAEVLNPIYINKTFKKPNNYLIKKILVNCKFNQYFIDNIIDLFNEFYIEHNVNNNINYKTITYNSFKSYQRKYKNKHKFT
jgi:flap endonuclease-1